MSDDVIVVAGSYSETVAADDLGTKKIQRVKPAWGVDGIATDVSAAAPLPVVQTGALPALPAGTNNIGDVDVLSLPALPTGANVIGAVTQSGTWSHRTQDGSGAVITSTGGAMDVNVKTSAVGSTVDTDDGTITGAQANVALVASLPYSFDTASGNWTRVGASTFFSYDLDETEEDIKTSAGTLYGYAFANFGATLRVIRFYNAMAATVTVGTTPALFALMAPPGAAGHVWFGEHGPAFTQLCAAATTATGATDTGAPGANEVMLTAWYK